MANQTPATTETSVPSTKPKRIRKPKPPAPKPERTLDSLKDVPFTEMSKEELLTVCLSLAAQNSRANSLLTQGDRTREAMIEQRNKYQASLAYIEQTIDHARMSILLQIGRANND